MRCMINCFNLLRSTNDCSSWLSFESSILDLNSTLESMVERSDQGKWRCMVCGLENDKYKVKRHAEVHLDVAHSCIVCAKIFKTRNALSTHYTRYHANDVLSPWTNKI